jgi:hypothetical protein
MFIINTLSAFLQIAVAANTHLAEGKFLLQEQRLNLERSLIYGVGSRSLTVSESENQTFELR